MKLYGGYLKNIMKYVYPYGMVPSGIYHMKEKEVGIMVKEKKEGGLELHLFPSKEAMARWRGESFQLHAGSCFCFSERSFFMQTRVAVMSILLEDAAFAEEVNGILHQYGRYIIGRMGIPYRQKGIHIISVALDAPQDTISAMAGKLGRIRGVNIKTAYSNFTSGGEGGV